MEEFRATIKDYKIVLSGEMTGTQDQYKELTKALGSVNNPLKAWTVDANEVRLAPEGVTFWINVAHDCLGNCTLKYRPSHLATVLQYDPRYHHRESIFEDEELEQVKPFERVAVLSRG